MSYPLRTEAQVTRFIGILSRRGVKRGPILVTVENYKKNRSIAQNRLMWMWLGIMADHIFDTTGQRFESEELHEWCKAKFLPARIVEIDGVAVKAHRTTTKLATMEFSEHLDNIDRYASESLDLVLPHPDGLYGVAMGVDR